MAALHKFKVKGLQVEMWKTSFRVEGMHELMPLHAGATPDNVALLVSALYEAIEHKAKIAGAKAVAGAVGGMALAVIHKELNLD